MLGMFYPLATIIAVFVISRWLQFELKRTDLNFREYLHWVIGALLLQVGAVVTNSLINTHFGNFLLHSIGGGAAMTLVFVYFVKTFDVRANWRLLSVALFCVVCAFGVINELGEFSGELLGVGTFSFDSHDTWRDLFANTVGMVAAWLIITALRLTSSAKPRFAR